MLRYNVTLSFSKNKPFLGFSSFLNIEVISKNMYTRNGFFLIFYAFLEILKPIFRSILVYDGLFLRMEIFVSFFMKQRRSPSTGVGG